MQKKRLLIAFLVIFPLFVGLACRFTAKGQTPTEEIVTEVETEVTEEPTVAPTQEEVEEPVDTGEFQELVMLDNSLWVQDGTDVFTAFFFENPNSSLIFEDVEYTVYLYDTSGNEIDSDYSTVRWIFPDQTFGIVFNFYLDDENITVDSASVDWSYDSTTASNGLYNPFTVSNATFWQNGDFPIVTGTVNNNETNTYTDIRTNIICYNSAGEIVGGGYTYIDFVPGSDFMGFATYVDAYESVASVEVFPTFSYSTLIYEGDAFWSEISILDDNFYLTTYDTIAGGLEIQSNIDTVLTNSVAAITFYDADDNVTSTAEYYIDFLLPNQSIGLSPWALSPPDGAQTDSYDVLILPGDYEEDYELTENPFVVNSTTLTGDWDNYVLVNFTNTYSKQVSEVDIYVLLYDTDGKIIGGGHDWTTEPTPAGGTTEIEIWVDYGDSKEIASIKAWVMPNYWTEFD